MRKFLRGYVPPALFVVLIASMGLISSFGCPGGCKVPTKQQVIACGSTAMQQNWPSVLPQVNGCLTSPGDWEGCLIGLINPAIGVTEDLVACLVKDQGVKFSDSAKVNVNDTTSVMAAQRADAFITKRGYKFQE